MIDAARPVMLACTLLMAAAGMPQQGTELVAAEAVAKVVSEPTPPPAPRDVSGRARTGRASFYAKKFAGRKMADGNRMDPLGDNAASRTLPLGTTAKVTNLETGLSASVTIEDRGPYVRGRIVDLSPSTAREIGIDGRNGVAKVVVEPITVPLPDGRVRYGVATGDGRGRKPLPAETPR